MTPRRPWSSARVLVGALALALSASSLVAATTSAAAPRAQAPGSPTAGPRQAVGTPAASTQAQRRPGAAGIGDHYFPRYGNGGYRVRHYDVDVTFNPASERLRGRTVVRARATHDLSRFNLDLVLPARKVLVNGQPATYRRTDHELVVRPRRTVRSGERMRVVVRYAGVPRDHRVNGVRPWITTPDGAVALGEPEIAAWWFPSNDHPSDKARFDITVRVPRGLEAISNGRLVSRSNRGNKTVWHWREDDPMATYLAFAAIGQFDIVRGRTKGGRPYLYAYSQRLGDQRHARRSLRATARITAWLQRTWQAPYPYDEIGGVVLGKWIGFALENQTRPVYSRAFFEFGPDRSVVVHEMAHQWFGDDVAVDAWRHIWLNEAFATYSEWLYAKHRRGVSVNKIFKRNYRFYPKRDRFWDVPIGSPGAKRLFAPAVYERGAMTAHALRHKIGSPAFFRLMRRWLRANDGHGSTGEFIDLAEQVAGRQLDRFFDVWLFRPSRPRPIVPNGFPRNF